MGGDNLPPNVHFLISFANSVSSGECICTWIDRIQKDEASSFQILPLKLCWKINNFGKNLWKSWFHYWENVVFKFCQALFLGSVLPPYVVLCVCACVINQFFSNIVWHCTTSYDVAVWILMSPIDCWKNSTPFWCKISLCTTKVDKSRT